MTVVQTRDVAPPQVPDDLSLLIKEAAHRARRRRLLVAMVLILLAATLALALSTLRRSPGAPLSVHRDPGAKVLAASDRSSLVSPFPSTLQASAGLLFAKDDTFISRDTVLNARQAREVALTSSTGTTRWGVLNPRCGATQYPVRSLDAGRTWSVQGPALATDWAGGSLYCATATVAVSASEVIYVSDSVIDVTTDAGLHWFQYVWAADDWSMSRHDFAGGVVGLRVGPDRWAAGSSMPVHSYALYEYLVGQHRWHRVGQYLG